MEQKKNRRDFFKSTATFVGGLVIATPFLSAVARAQSFYSNGYYGTSYYGYGYFGPGYTTGNQTIINNYYGSGYFQGFYY